MYSVQGGPGFRQDEMILEGVAPGLALAMKTMSVYLYACMFRPIWVQFRDGSSVYGQVTGPRNQAHTTVARSTCSVLH